MLEFTRPNDRADDWQTKTDAHKEERYRPLRDKLAALLPGWKVETVIASGSRLWLALCVCAAVRTREMEIDRQRDID